MRDQIRPATPTDISGIATVARETWETGILPEVCQAQIDCPTCALWVAAGGEEIAGFISAFLTVGGMGGRRWEIDLLAVRPTHRGQRLGQKLVERVCQEAQRHGAALARAAIRVDNTASQRTFENAGFTTNKEVHRLLLWNPAPSHVSRVYAGRVTFIPVDTLTYRGLWLEGLVSEETDTRDQRKAIGLARSIVAWEERQNTGALIPAGKEHRLASDLRNAASVQGEYYWFIKSTEE